MALLGLGVLAGAGAVVDYWPVGLRFPRMDPAFAAPVTAPGPLAVPESPLRAADGVPRRVARTITAATLTPAAVPDAQYASLPATDDPVALGDVVELSELPAPALLVATSTLTSDMHGGHAYLAAPVAAPPAESTYNAEAVDHGGFIGGALRRTGSSIARTGARTGGSLVDAVRIVGSAVRRALPD